jgi:hypothetical protein
MPCPVRSGEGQGGAHERPCLPDARNEALHAFHRHEHRHRGTRPARLGDLRGYRGVPRQERGVPQAGRRVEAGRPAASRVSAARPQVATCGLRPGPGSAPASRSRYVPWIWRASLTLAGGWPASPVAGTGSSSEDSGTGRSLFLRSEVGSGAGDGARTRDMQLGRLPLCQLSYSRPPARRCAGPPRNATTGRSRWGRRRRARTARSDHRPSVAAPGGVTVSSDPTATPGTSRGRPWR